MAKAAVPKGKAPDVPRRPTASTVEVRPAPAVPSEPGPRRPREPLWLVRIVLVLFLVGFASFLAREVYNFLRVL